MVGRLMLLKMLHCIRDKKRRAKHSLKEVSSQAESTLDSVVKMKNHEDSVCRVCLKEGNISIHGDNTQNDIPGALNIFGGIEVCIDDPYPKYLCQSCNALLQGAIIFRKTAQESDIILKRTGSVHIKNEDNINSFDSVDDTCSYDAESGVKNENITNCIQDLYEERKSKNQKIHHCKRCDMTFTLYKAYNEHMMSEDHENMRRTCPICKKTYAALYYKKHMALHTNETPYMCDICGKKFIMQGQFKRHRLTHFYELPFKCSLCPYKGRFRESLKMHMRTHTGEKPYQCAQCPSRFISKSNLNKHLLTHKGEHDFRCNTCGRGFYRKRELEMHYKVNHAGIKDHVCNVCGKAFGYRKQMMKHQLKVHKREKLRSGRTPLYLKVETMKQQGQNVSVDT